MLIQVLSLTLVYLWDDQHTGLISSLTIDDRVHIWFRLTSVIVHFRRVNFSCRINVGAIFIDVFSAQIRVENNSIQADPSSQVGLESLIMKC